MLVRDSVDDRGWLSELKKAHDEVAYIARAIFIQQSAAVQNEIIHCVEIETVHELPSKRTSSIALSRADIRSDLVHNQTQYGAYSTN